MGLNLCQSRSVCCSDGCCCFISIDPFSKTCCRIVHILLLECVTLLLSSNRSIGAYSFNSVLVCKMLSD